ncbi:MAG: hypothetical protein AAF560_28105, partial [Acidobacteriota bacterium]
MRQRTGLVGFIAAAILCGACATNFTPELVRQEIITQRGTDPLSAFELDLGRFTTLLIKSALAGEDGELPFAGLDSLQLAVYEVSSDAGPALDVTRFSFTGWDQVVRVKEQDASGMVLVQPRSDSIGDLVVVGSGTRKVVYARLTGRLYRDLPSALGDVLRYG